MGRRGKSTLGEVNLRAAVPAVLLVHAYYIPESTQGARSRRYTEQRTQG